MTALSVSVVIPVFNSEKILPLLVERATAVLSDSGADFEIILVNDGSVDGSRGIIQQLSRRYEEVSAINLMRNFGQHNALLCGIRAARHEVIVTMDDDLQNPPEEIPKLLREIGNGCDVVYGCPVKGQHGFFRNMASVFTKIAMRSAMSVPTARRVSAFRAFRSPLREAFSSYSSPYVNIDVLLAWGGTRFCDVSVRHDPRLSGRSNYTLGKLWRHALNMITGFSTVPLKIASLFGFALTLFGVGVFIYVVGKYMLLGGSVPGFPFLASIIAIFSGAQLFSLGIIGEYIARMHLRLMERPPYVIENSGQKEAGSVLDA